MKPENNYWSENVDAHEKYHTPAGTFTKTGPEIAKNLLDGADGDATLALRRLLFYMNRTGDKLTNAAALNKAKSILEAQEGKKERWDD